MTALRKPAGRPPVVTASVTPLAFILRSGLLIIVPVLERTLGVLSVFGAVTICAVAWLIGTVIRHNIIVVEQRETAGTLDPGTTRLGCLADAIILIAYVISVALYLRITAQYLVGFFESAGSTLWEPIIAWCRPGRDRWHWGAPRLQGLQPARPGFTLGRAGPHDSARRRPAGPRQCDRDIRNSEASTDPIALADQHTAGPRRNRDHGPGLRNRALPREPVRCDHPDSGVAPGTSSSHHLSTSASSRSRRP